MKTIFSSLLDFVFPALCVVCGNRLVGESEKHICINCLSLLPRTFYHKQEDNRLEEFFAGRFPFQRIAAYAYFVKDGSMQKIIHELKYRNNPQLGEYIGELYGSDLVGSDFISEIDYLIAVPLHPKRQKKRGYNQSLAIAKGISEQTKIPIDTTTLIRKINNPSQTKNSRLDRWKNVENVFEITNFDALRNKHIILIDDVLTTGSTLESCVRELLKCEGCKVSIVTIGAAS